ncbi:unnamed protein product [Lactuca saligna]|uniref:Uncharacterized protein n=1 Tax=Lactuca saligna TaxID=75948 RepID=A0AA35Z5M1_LACSI|nr:unnamed protein product [Lactuca saligna]
MARTVKRRLRIDRLITPTLSPASSMPLLAPSSTFSGERKNKASTPTQSPSSYVFFRNLWLKFKCMVSHFLSFSFCYKPFYTFEEKSKWETMKDRNLEFQRHLQSVMKIGVIQYFKTSKSVTFHLALIFYQLFYKFIDEMKVRCVLPSLWVPQDRTIECKSWHVNMILAKICQNLLIYWIY